MWKVLYYNIDICGIFIKIWIIWILFSICTAPFKLYALGQTSNSSLAWKISNAFKIIEMMVMTNRTTKKKYTTVLPSISIKRIVCLSVCLSVYLSVCLDAFAQFSRYRAETLQVGRGRPGTGRGGVKMLGVHRGAGWGWGWAYTIF